MDKISWGKASKKCPYKNKKGRSFVDISKGWDETASSSGLIPPVNAILKPVTKTINGAKI